MHLIQKTDSTHAMQGSEHLNTKLIENHRKSDSDRINPICFSLAAEIFFIILCRRRCVPVLAPLSCKSAKCIKVLHLCHAAAKWHRDDLKMLKSERRAAQRPSVERSSRCPSHAPAVPQPCPSRAPTIRQFFTSFSNCQELPLRIAALCC